MFRRLLVFAAQFADAGVRASKCFVLYQYRLNQGVDGVWGARETGSDDPFGFGVPRCGFPDWRDG